ncbi:hypothetical protein [Kitasatospora sp. NPDC059673]|uniref:hypothetical protein n=1 Tax=Kitasatospora sp. NPDC059673 TaxID=3346901 RepID=UPI0036BE07E9
MMYNILVAGSVGLEQLKPALAEEFTVPTENIDVVHSEETEARNWDAQVICELRPTNGDTSLALDIHVVDSIQGQPAEPDLAISLARRLQQPVLFPDPDIDPSAYWVADPLGNTARARLYAPDEEGGDHVIDAVDAPIAGLPGIPVQNFPEAIHMFRTVTPVAEEFKAALAHRGVNFAERNAYFDKNRLIASDTWSWENLSALMEQGWPPYSWFPASLYEESLSLRDRLDDTVSTADSEAAEAAPEFIARIDETYRRLTVDDGGAALSAALGLPQSAVAGRNWWWHRRPAEIPWEEQAG